MAKETKRQMQRVWWCAVFVVASVLASGAQALKLPESWDRLAAKASEVVHVDMNRDMLQFASNFMEKEDDDHSRQLVSKLNGIYVRSLEFKQEGAFTDADVEPIRAQLRGPEWSHIVDVTSKPEKEKVDIYIRTVNNQPMGMVILAQEPMELTFVHLDGPISPQDLGALGGNFAIPKGIQVPTGQSASPRQSIPPAPAVKR